MTKKKILIISDAVTLAHPLRTIALANTLSPDEYDVSIYFSDNYQSLYDRSIHPVRPIYSISPADFVRIVSDATPIYTFDVIKRYIKDELDIIDLKKPDLIIGENRHTLQISARKKSIPYLNIMDFYWSRYFKCPYKLPPIPLSRFISIDILDMVFNAVPNMLSLPHTIPMDVYRYKSNLPLMMGDVKGMYTDADYVGYFNIPSLYNSTQIPNTHTFIGSVDETTLPDRPDWLSTIQKNKPVIFMNLGSSGNKKLLAPLSHAILNRMDCHLIMATATKDIIEGIHPKTHVTSFIDNSAVFEIADLYICNGGMSIFSGIMRGVFGIGVCSNLDQCMNTVSLEQMHLAKFFRAWEKDIDQIADFCTSLPKVRRDIIQSLKKEQEEYPVKEKFTALISRII
jgi:UDP:flavonoid glycosyltransferase YjiC (YdhE family)